jgi:hypothetical protein
MKKSAGLILLVLTLRSFKLGGEKGFIGIWKTDR